MREIPSFKTDRGTLSWHILWKCGKATKSSQWERWKSLYLAKIGFDHISPHLWLFCRDFFSFAHWFDCSQSSMRAIISRSRNRNRLRRRKWRPKQRGAYHKKVAHSSFLFDFLSERVPMNEHPKEKLLIYPRTKLTRHSSKIPIIFLVVLTIFPAFS